MKIRSLTVAALPLAAALIGCKPPPENTNVTAILGAVLIDGNGGPPVTDSAVVIAAGRIRAAGSRGNVPIPAGSNKINGAGLFLMPGLVDLHVHLGTRSGPGFRATEYTREQVEKNLNAYLYLGVTSVRSAGTEREAGFAVRTAERGGELLSARLFTAGRGFTAPGGHPSQEIGEIARQPRDVDDARKQVGELAAQNVDLIKIWVDDLHGRAPKIDRAVSEAIIDEARKFNIPVVAHIFSLADTDHLFKSGATGFLHMIRDTEEISPGLVNRLRALRIVFTPTLVRQELAWLYSEHPGRLDDPDVARTLPPDVVAAVREAARASQPSPVARDEFERAKRNSRRLASSGVQIAVGSDGGSSIDFPGLMTHREIELLVESGFSPVDAITAATRNGALGLGKLDELGTIEPGKRADLLLLSANPLEDVRNLRKIARLMLNGEWIDRERLKMK